MADGRRPRVLVVDDDHGFADLIAELLEQEDYCVSRAYDGGQALAILQDREPPDVVVSDIMMPKLTGSELVGAARHFYPPDRLPFILLSAGRDPRVDGEGVWFLSKPIDLDRLLNQVDALVRHGTQAGFRMRSDGTAA